MSSPSRRPVSRLAFVVALAATVALLGCSPAPASPQARTPLIVGLGYIPHVQFAPFYLADQAGYYRDAGLEVTFQNKIDPDLITLIGAGAVDIGSADGTSVIPAVSQGIDVVYVATIYGTYPSVVFAKTSSGITTAADLEGRRIGIPGQFGSSWIMLQALLGSAGLTPDEVEVLPYPDFGQGIALSADAVDAATGFANNEPVVLGLSGVEVSVLHVDGIVPLPGPGLVAGRATLASKGDAIRAFIAATLRAMREIAADPGVGLEAAIVAVPGLEESRETQRAILDATVAIWASGAGGVDSFGSIDAADWEASLRFMDSLGLVAGEVSVDDLVDDSYLPAD